MKKKYIAGTCNTICDVTGFKVKLNQVRKRWDGMMVIPEAWEPRQPQDFPVTPQKQKVYKEARFEADAPLPPAFNPNNWVTDV